MNREERANYFFGIAWFLLGLVIGVTNDVLMKFLGRSYSCFEIVCVRYAFATLSLVIVIARSGELGKLFLRIPKLHVVRAFFLLSSMSLYCYGLHRLHVAVVASLNFVIPLFTIVFAYVFLREKCRSGHVIATAIGFVGVCAIFEPHNVDIAKFPAAMLLLAAALFAGLDVINKKFVSGEGVLKMVFYTASITFLASIPLAMRGWIWPSPLDTLLFAALGVGANGLLYCILKAFERVPVSSIAPLRYFELLLSIAAGFAVFGEVPTGSTVSGAFIIISSVLYIALSGAHAEKL
jgi:S-adenosylmethionine uptake transporter